MRQLDRELSEYMESMVEGMGRSERRRALELYLTGLLLEGELVSCTPPATGQFGRVRTAMPSRYGAV